MSHSASTARTALRGTRLARVPRQSGGPEETAGASGRRHAAGATLPVLRRVGYVILSLQLLGLGAWSALLYHRFALTWDFAVYHQPWYLIAHGDLDPRTSIESMTFWRNDSEFAIWPLAPFYWIWPHDVVLLWLQDIGIVVAEAVTFGWMCELAGRSGRGREAVWLAAAGLGLLVLSPWIWWSASFDFHLESIGLPFAVLLARDLYRDRRRMWIWIAPILSAGAPEAVYVVGIGLGAILAGRRYRARGACLAVIGVAYSGLIVAIHADNGAPLARHYGYLAIAAAASYAHGRVASGTNLTTSQMAKGILSHPLHVIQALWDKRQDVSAALLPGGLLGIGFRPLLPWLLVALLSSVLSAGWRFAQPSFQLLPVYVLIPLGTVAALGWLATRWRRTAKVDRRVADRPGHRLGCRLGSAAAGSLAAGERRIRIRAGHDQGADSRVCRGHRLAGSPGPFFQPGRRARPRRFGENTDQPRRGVVCRRSFGRHRAADHGQLDGTYFRARRPSPRRARRSRRRSVGVPLAPSGRAESTEDP